MVTGILRSQGDGVTAPPNIAAGDLIRVREGVWRVMEVRTFARGRTRALRLVGADALNRWQPCTLLEPFDRPRRVDAAGAPRVVSRARWMRTCAALIAASPPAGCPATIADAQVTVMPHQIDPVLTVLRGRASRMLLADAVGLGKTIQAALLLRELRVRGCADRVLILVPSGLREQWRQELLHRTGLRADIIDAASLAARTRELPPDVNPWSLPGILIVSLDFIKQPSVLRGASTIVWDLLIADEAHNLNEGTDRLAAASLLARHSRHVVLLTATPHHGSDDAFATLCRIGCLDRAADDPIVIFRRTRQTMGMARMRRVHVLCVTPTKQEQRLHALLARYASRVERERAIGDGISGGDGNGNGESVPGGDDAVTLAMSILLKRASSSAWSLERSLRRRLALLDDREQTLSATVDLRRTQRDLPFADAGEGDGGGDGDDDRDGDNGDGGDGDDVAGAGGGAAADDGNGVADGEPSHILGAPGLRSRRIERAWLTLLIEASRNASRAESKPRALARLLRRCREPALIYTEYRDTLTHLARTLPDPSSHALLHGGLGADERRTALARFASGDARILLTTDAAGEGLNLHHRCRLVINIELPWNPNRLEQRIGRVDRLGQTRTVHAIHLVAAGTSEEPMLTRLTNRVEQIAATLGDAPAVLSAASEFVAADADLTREPDALAATDARDAVSRSVSTEAVEAALELQRVREMRTRAWRAGRHRANRPHGSRGDPLLVLDERAPLITVTRRHQIRSCAHAHVEPEEAWQSRASPSTPRRSWYGCHRHEPHTSRTPESCGLAATDCRAAAFADVCLCDLCDSTESRSFVGRESPAPGLICIWRTRLECDHGEARPRRAREPSSVLTVTHVACDVPNFPSRQAVASFVMSTIERCHARIQSLLDSELTAARKRLVAADHARVKRLSQRDEAIASEIASMLRARTGSGGMFQPLLFEDIAIEKTTMTGQAAGRSGTWAPVAPDADADANADVDAADAAPPDAARRTTPSLAMVLVLR